MRAGSPRAGTAARTGREGGLASGGQSTPWRAAWGGLGVTGVLVTSGWCAFVLSVFVASDGHHVRIAFNWLVLAPLVLVAGGLAVRGAGAWRQWRLHGQEAVDLRALAFGLGALWLVAGYFVASVLWAGAPPDVDGTSVVRELKNPLYLSALAVAATMAVAAAPRWMGALDRVVIGACVVAVLAALTVHLATHGAANALLHRMQGLGALRNELVIASVAGVCALLALARHAAAETPAARMHWLAVVCLLLVAMLMTQSRGPLFAWLLAAAVLLACARRNLRDLAWCAVVGAVAVVGLNLALPEAGERIADAVRQRGLDFSFRDWIWAAVADETRGQFWFGQGLRGDRQVVTAVGVFPHEHNSVLASWRFGGAVGLLLFVGLCGGALWLAARLGPARGNARAMLLPWLVFGMVCQLTNGGFPFGRPAYDWWLIWIPAAWALALNVVPLAEPPGRRTWVGGWAGRGQRSVRGLPAKV